MFAAIDMSQGGLWPWPWAWRGGWGEGDGAPISGWVPRLLGPEAAEAFTALIDFTSQVEG